jgi:hypothetical protein
MLAMETIMLNTLGFRLTMPSALKFATRQQKVAGQAGNEKQAHLCHFLMELTLQDYDFLQFKPSQLAATATFLSLRMLGLSDWTTLLAQYTGYNLGDLMPCAKAMYVLLHKDPVKYRAVRKKYGHRKFNAVALVPASSAYHPMFA